MIFPNATQSDTLCKFCRFEIIQPLHAMYLCTNKSRLLLLWPTGNVTDSHTPVQEPRNCNPFLIGKNLQFTNLTLEWVSMDVMFSPSHISKYLNNSLFSFTCYRIPVTVEAKQPFSDLSHHYILYILDSSKTKLILRFRLMKTRQFWSNVIWNIWLMAYSSQHNPFYIVCVCLTCKKR